MGEVERCSQEAVQEYHLAEVVVPVAGSIVGACLTIQVVQEEHRHPDRNQDSHHNRSSHLAAEEQLVAKVLRYCLAHRGSHRSCPVVDSVPKELEQHRRCGRRSCLVGCHAATVLLRQMVAVVGPMVLILLHHRNLRLGPTHPVVLQYGQLERSMGCQTILA